MSEDKVRKQYAARLENGDVFQASGNHFCDTPEEVVEHHIPLIRRLGDQVGVQFGELTVVEREVRLLHSPWVEADWRPTGV